MPTIPGPDGRPRCGWCAAAPEFFAYHDREWGFPVADDRRLFEKLCLEGFQSGLSWRTILAKRENFRAAFAGFDIDAVAAFTDADVARLLADPGIVRHRGKIEAAINNARRARELIAEAGSLAAFVWRYEEPKPPRRQTVSISPASVGALQGAEAARLEVRRPDHRLRLHAGDGPRQRPPRGLRHPRRSRRRPRRLRQAGLIRKPHLWPEPAAARRHQTWEATPARMRFREQALTKDKSADISRGNQ